MRNPGRRRPLPAELTQPEREFFGELRRLIDTAGFSYRTLEELTSSFKPTADNPSFYSKSQWSRWLNGQSRPPRNAIRKLAGILAAEDMAADHLLELWSGAIKLTGPGEASPAGLLPAEPSPVPPPGPLVGRDRELALLAGMVKQAALGVGGTVLIEGPPGIGKSALARAAVAEAAEAGCQAFWGAGDELGQALPLLPFLDGLRVREPSASPRQNMIVALLRGEMATGRGADVPAMLAEQLMALVAELCAIQPVILVMDDLQWADPASTALWARLARSSRQLPLLLVGLMRPAPRREELQALRRTVDSRTQVQLGELAGAAVADLVAALTGGRPDERLLRLASGAAGNPLYVTELVAALIRSSRVTVTGTGTATLADGPAPGSLSAAIADRLDFVARPVREVLRAAALLGVDFTVTDLAVVLGRGVADLVPSIDEACAVGVLAESADRLSFRHPLIRAALYDEMPGPVRAAWHRDAGRALAEAGAPSDRVARQLLQSMARSDGGPEPMGEWMLGWLARTSGLLVDRAPRVAAELLTQAVAGSPPGIQRDRLTARLADALYRVADRDQAERVASQALTHVTEPEIVMELHWILAQCRMLAGSSSESLATLEEAMATPGISVRHRARLLVLEARTHNYFGQTAKAYQVAAHALDVASETHDSWSMGWSLHVLAMVTAMRGNMTDALALFGRALAITESDPALTDLRLLLQINHAVALGGLDRYDEALVLAEQARQVADQAGMARRRMQAHSMLGQLLFETGRWDDALAEVMAMDEDLKEPGAACCDRGIAALICFHRGQTSVARQHLAIAVSYAGRIGRRLIGPLALARSLDREQDGALPESLAVLTDVFASGTEELEELEDLLADGVRLAARTGDLRTAEALAGHAATLAAGSEIPHRQANALHCRGLLDHDAFGLLAAAERYLAVGRPLPRAAALEAAARESAHAGRRDQARTAFAGAVEAYTALGAAADLARLRATPR